jgi:hypothetical protein
MHAGTPTALTGINDATRGNRRGTMIRFTRLTRVGAHYKVRDRAGTQEKAVRVRAH